jgi:hypothetical protein
VEIVTGIDPSLPVNLIRMAPPFLGLLGQLGGVQRGCTVVQPFGPSLGIVDAWPSEAQGAVIR